MAEPVFSTLTDHRASCTKSCFQVIQQESSTDGWMLEVSKQQRGTAVLVVVLFTSFPA